MKIKYKGYTLIANFKTKDMFVPVKVVELDYTFKDIAQAKRYLDSL